MVKTIATYRDRLTTVLEVCIEVQAIKGWIRVKDVADRLKITERAARDYLSDLEDLGFLKYEGAGLYKLVNDSISELAEVLERYPLLSLSVDEYIPVSTLEMARRAGVEGKVLRVFKKLGVHIARSKELRERLLKLSPDELGVSDVLKGDKIIYDKSCYKPVYLHNVSLGGEALEYCIKHYLIRKLIPLTISYIVSCALQSYYEWNMVQKSQSFLRPRLQEFAGKEPYQEDEPFYELSTEYPELLMFGRKLATRLLSQIQRYRACIDLMKSTDVRIIFTRGTLFPHGFVLAKECRVLYALHNKMREYFDKMMKIAHEKDILIVGVSDLPRDMRFFRIIEDKLKLQVPHVNDYVFLKLVLEEGDITTPLLVEKEKGKKLENWYEFYMNARGDILKFEYITKEDPLEVQRKIASLASSLVYPSPLRRDRGRHNLSILIEARMKAHDYLNTLRDLTHAALRAASISLSELIDKHKGVKI